MIFRAPVDRARGRVHPGGAAATGILQARRNTCVLRAKQGTIEHDDFSTDAGASGRCHQPQDRPGITRDAILIGVGAGTLAAATALVR